MNDGLLLHAPSYLRRISAARRRKPGKTLAKMAQFFVWTDNTLSPRDEGMASFHMHYRRRAYSPG